jgi:hypothetical protein
MSGKLIEGIYRDVLFGPDGEPISDSGWQSNMIVLSCRVLLAGFMKNEATAKGIQSLRIGQGDSAWDNLAQPPKPDPNTLTKLVDSPGISIPGLKLEYLDPKTDTVTVNQTSRLQITATLGPGQPAAPDPYPLREFGLFGQMNGNDFMIDYVRHPLIEKDSLMTLERKVRLAF